MEGEASSPASSAPEKCSVLAGSSSSLSIRSKAPSSRAPLALIARVWIRRMSLLPLASGRETSSFTSNLRGRWLGGRGGGGVGIGGVRGGGRGGGSEGKRGGVGRGGWWEGHRGEEGGEGKAWRRGGDKGGMGAARGKNAGPCRSSVCQEQPVPP